MSGRCRGRVRMCGEGGDRGRGWSRCSWGGGQRFVERLHYRAAMNNALCWPPRAPLSWLTSMTLYLFWFIRIIYTLFPRASLLPHPTHLSPLHALPLPCHSRRSSPLARILSFVKPSSITCPTSFSSSSTLFLSSFLLHHHHRRRQYCHIPNNYYHTSSSLSLSASLIPTIYRHYFFHSRLPPVSLANPVSQHFHF